MVSNRSGKYITQIEGYRAYIPNPLPPKPHIDYDEEIRFLLSEADRALARLDGVALILPNPELFVAMYVKKEALLSSQIEGTQASLAGILAFESDIKPEEDLNEIKEVINYIKAMNFGMKRISENNFPMSLRLIKEIHKILLGGTRGTHKSTGEFRKSQNWIGPRGASIFEAVYVPPPPYQVNELMTDIEKFIHAKDSIPPLIKIALIHAQFETIHPFLDGNGRIGRLLITFFLYWKGILKQPLLYLSFYLKAKKEKYYDLLMKIRFEGDWENWLKFFLQGIFEISEEAAISASEIIRLKENLVNKLSSNNIGGVLSLRLLDLLFDRPLISISDTAKLLKTSKQSIAQIVDKFQQLGILKETTGKKRYRKFLFTDYVKIIARGTEIEHRKDTSERY